MVSIICCKVRTSSPLGTCTSCLVFLIVSSYSVFCVWAFKELVGICVVMPFTSELQ